MEFTYVQRNLPLRTGSAFERVCVVLAHLGAISGTKGIPYVVPGPINLVNRYQDSGTGTVQLYFRYQGYAK
jgi:hypothetical protein